MLILLVKILDEFADVVELGKFSSKFWHALVIKIKTKAKIFLSFFNSLCCLITNFLNYNGMKMQIGHSSVNQLESVTVSL